MRIAEEIKSSDVKMLVNSVDIFVNDVENLALRRATDESPAKQLGEAMLLLQGLDALEEKQSLGSAKLALSRHSPGCDDTETCSFMLVV